MRINREKVKPWIGQLRRTAGLAGLILFCSSFAGCHRQNDAKRYELKGRVVSVDRELKRVTIAHDEIPGYMGAMTMPFALKENWAYAVLGPGDQITATLVVDSERSWLEEVVITEEGVPEPAGATAGQTEPKAGDDVPDFSFTNQDGKTIHLGQYHGTTLVLTFIYTRCPLPDYCPLMSKNLAEVEEALQKDQAIGGRTHLLSVSFDTEHDTPPVLKSYGAMYTKNFEQWEFASGSPAEVKAITDYFGLRNWSEGDQIVHTLRTAIIGPDGKLVRVYRGNEWKPSEVVADLRSIR